jgi:hypothetical protein
MAYGAVEAYMVDALAASPRDPDRERPVRFGDEAQ